MERLDKTAIEALNNGDENDTSSLNYAISQAIDKINEIIDWINTQ